MQPLWIENSTRADIFYLGWVMLEIGYSEQFKRGGPIIRAISSF